MRLISVYVGILEREVAVPVAVEDRCTSDWSCGRMRDGGDLVLRIYDDAACCGWLVRVRDGSVAAHWPGIDRLVFWKRADTVADDVSASAARLAGLH